MGRLNMPVCCRHLTLKMWCLNKEEMYVPSYYRINPVHSPLAVSQLCVYTDSLGPQSPKWLCVIAASFFILAPAQMQCQKQKQPEKKKTESCVPRQDVMTEKSDCSIGCQRWLDREDVELGWKSAAIKEAGSWR